MNSKPSQITHNTQQAAQWLHQGKLLAYPTESVWGIGCDPFNEVSVRHILAIKDRPIEKGMIVVTDSIDRIKPLLLSLSEASLQSVIDSWQPPDSAHSLSKRQANTWLLPLPKTDLDTDAIMSIPSWITGNHESVAVRVISHPLVRELCKQMVSENNPYGFIVSTSCNPSGKTPATIFKQAYNYFEEGICYLQGETLGYTLPSQIRDAVSGSAIR